MLMNYVHSQLAVIPVASVNKIEDKGEYLFEPKKIMFILDFSRQKYSIFDWELLYF